MAIHTSDMDCQKCSEAVKRIRGCDEEVEAWYIEDVPYTRCPRKLITDTTCLFIEVYNSLKNHKQLYSSGGVGDQANKLVQMMNHIDRETLKQRRKNG